MEQRLAGPLEEGAGSGRLRVCGIARLEETLSCQDRVRPRGAAKLFRRALRDARRLLGSGEGGLEPPLLESLPGLDEQVLDPVEVDGGITAQDEARVAFRGGLRLQLHQDLGRVRRARESLHEVPFLLEAVETDPMPLPEIPELPRSEPAEAVFHSPPIRLHHHGVGIGQGQEGLDQEGAFRLASPVDAMGPCQVAQDLGGQVGERVLQGAWHRGPSVGIQAPASE